MRVASRLNYDPAANKSENNKKRLRGRRQILKWLILTGFTQDILERLYISNLSQAGSRVPKVHEVTTMSLLHRCNIRVILRYKKGEQIYSYHSETPLLGRVFSCPPVPRCPSDPTRTWAARYQQQMLGCQDPMVETTCGVFVVDAHGQPEHCSRFSHRDLAA